MNNIKITPYKGMTILLFALVLFCTKANAQVMPFGMLHSNEAATAPTITNVAAGDGQVAVTFDHPEANGGATSTVYTVTSSPGARTVTGTSSPITIAELTNGTAYTFTVTATNSAGQSATSAASNAVTPIPILGENEVYNPITNKVWKDRNLGATQVAINSTDSDSYGDLFQWGRGADGHEKRNSGITPGPSPLPNPGANFLTGPSNWYSGTDPQADDLWKEEGSGENDPCPLGFRLPTDTEWEIERQSWIYTNVPGDFTSPLKLPRSGYRELTNGTPANLGTMGFYWSSTIDGSQSIAVSFNSSSDQQVPFDRAFGFSVRCIKEVTAPDAPTFVEATGGDTAATVTFTAPASNGGATITGYTVTSTTGDISVNGLNSPISITGLTNGTAYTFTVTATNSAGLVSESGVSNEVTLAVPSVTSDTERIWMDRNLGATRVAQTVDDHLAYGDLYQWGRKADGHEKINWTSGTTGAPVNGTTTTKADVPADALFIIAPSSPNDWRVNQDFNLWNGLNAVNNPCPAGFRVPTITEINAEVTAYGITNSALAFGSIFRFTVPGTRGHSNGDLGFIGSDGNYWSSSVNGTNATYRNFSLNNTASVNNNRALGFAVRCIKEVTAPDAPTFVEATGGDTAATVTFTAPASNGGATITGYTVTSTTGDISLTGLNSPISITGLTNGTAYTFNVTATNSAELTSISAASNAVTPVAAPQVGDLRDGGVVFYVAPTPTDLNGDGILNIGLIAAAADLINTQWGCHGTGISGADGTAIGTGNQNTNDIIAGCSTAEIAARLCAELTLNGYTDWFLPSQDALNLMYQNIGPGNVLELGNIGGFASADYWSSTESSNDFAWRQSFVNGNQSNGNKWQTAVRVRAVRAF